VLDVDLGTPTVDSGESGRRRRRRVGSRLTLAHVAPVALGIVAVLLVLAGLKDRTATETVAVAGQPIAAGQSVTMSDVRWVSVHRADGLVSAGLVGRSGLRGGWVAAVAIPVGAPITANELSRPAASGLNSMSIQLPPSRADGGALSAGDHVDVISVASGKALYIATGLLVLAVDAGTGGVLGGIQDTNYYVTVAVDPATALRIAAAQGVSATGTGAQVELVKDALAAGAGA
jgi:Flp pilus assembly protein CpaB